MFEEKNITFSRIAFAGDWHANTMFACDVVDHLAGKVDGIIHLGDFGYDFRKGYLDSLNKRLVAADIYLGFVDGNHENFTTLYGKKVNKYGTRPLRSNIQHLPRGYRWEMQGVSFLSLGGAHSVDKSSRIPGISWWSQEWIAPWEAEKAIEGGTVDVMVSHDCPHGVPIPGLEENSMLFRPEEIVAAKQHRWIMKTVTDEVKPRFIWHGHYHIPYKWTGDLGGYTCNVTGLDCDQNQIRKNVEIVDLADLVE